VSDSGSAGTRAVIAAALIGAVAVIAAAVIQSQPGRNEIGPLPTFPPVNGGGNEALFLSKESGPGGATVNVSGEGFAAGEKIDISFHTESVATTTADGGGKFANVQITIPESFAQFAPQQFFVIASGRSSLRSARAAFTISG
jgi:hypothetical protein